MNSLAEKLSVKQAPVYQGEPVIAEKAGRVQWTVVDGARVNGGYQSVGETLSAYGSSIIACEHVGTLVYVARDGEPVLAGQIVAYVKPLQAPQKPATRAASNHAHTHDKTPQRQPGEALAPSAAAPIVQDEPTSSLITVMSEPAPVVVDQQPARRSTMPPALELIEIEPEPESMPEPVKREKRPRIVKRTMHPTNRQAEKFDELVAKLSAHGFDYSTGEIQRTMFRLLFGLSERDLIQELEANRDAEIAGRYGFGNRPMG